MSDDTELEHVLKMLLHRMNVPVWSRGLRRKSQPPLGIQEASTSGAQDTNKRKVVFLLGAGCSRQYGLPGFKELLTYLWEETRKDSPEENWGLEILRDKLDKYWQAQGPADRKAILSYYLMSNPGIRCPGYYHLAELAKDGYIEAFVNMNFDMLLENELAYLKVPYAVSTSFKVPRNRKSKAVIVYKPHGTIGPVLGDSVTELLETLQEIKPSKLGILSSRINLEDDDPVRDDIKLLINQVPNFPKRLGSLLNFYHQIKIKKTFFKASRSQPKKFSEEKKIQEIVDAAIKAAQEYLNDRSSPTLRNELILDIANSDLFADPDEQRCAQDLLTNFDVVSIGYSGVDAKIAAALRAFNQGEDARNKKLFVVNTTRPDPRLLLVMAERASQSLLVLGKEGTFENFMEHLAKARSANGQQDKRGSGQGDRNKVSEIDFMTSSERTALEACKDLALKIRLGLNVAEQSETSIERHAILIFEECLKIARGTGIALTSPEKYILCCASFFHDLGYYKGYSRAEIHRNPGWRLLRRHGSETKELLNDKFKEYPNEMNETQSSRNKSSGPPKTWLELITPTSYGIHAAQDLKYGIEKLCEFHSELLDIKGGDDRYFEIESVRVIARLNLILAIFALAEDISKGHPFLPSADPVTTESKKNKWVIVDPVLDFYLSRKPEVVEFKVEGSLVKVETKKGHQRFPKSLECALAMLSFHIRNFNVITCGKELFCENDKVKEMLSSGFDLEDVEILLGRALEESFLFAAKGVESGELGELTSLLDLLTIYTSPVKISTEIHEDQIAGIFEVPEETERIREPRISVDAQSASKVIDRALKLVEKDSEFGASPRGLLHLYFQAKQKEMNEGGSGLMKMSERKFLDCYDSIVFPAWRFFARNWHDGIETTLMARACLDLGSSRFRREVLRGVKDLKEKLKDGIKKNRQKVDVEVSFGHEGCTLCTSRLLYIFSHARLLFPEDLGAFKGDNEEDDLDESIRKIVDYMLSRDPKDDCWWGLEIEGKNLPEDKIRSADYLACAARGATACLSTALILNKKWLKGIDVDLLKELVRERWEQLFDSVGQDGGLLNDQSEEPYSYIVGRVGLACLDLIDSEQRIREFVIESDDDRKKFAKFLDGLALAVDGVERSGVSLMSRLYLWPSKIVLDYHFRSNLVSQEVRKVFGGRNLAKELVKTCYDCRHSKIWIQSGADAGSWGFNVKNTYSIVSSLLAFWRYAYKKENRTRFEEYFETVFTKAPSRRPSEEETRAHSS